MADFIIDRPQYIRELMSFKDTDLIKIVTGVRRSGKSTVFDLYALELLKQGVSKEQIQIIKLEEVENEHLLDYHKLHKQVMDNIVTGKKNYVFLDEIMRQALDSSIIRLSMQIRNREKIEYGKYNDAIVMPYEKLNTGVLKWGDQVLVGTNKTRININQTFRNMQGRGSEPEEGDKVICLRNYWDNLADNDDPLVNGTVGHIHNLYTSYNKIPPYCGGQTIPVLYADFISDSEADFGTLNMDKHQIITGERSLDARTIYKLNSRRPTQHLVPMEFTYAYAITTHKAQGSEWDKVVVLEEGFPFDKEEHARWLYTAVTRASEQLVLVR